jgi:phage baseplate assembly protein W
MALKRIQPGLKDNTLVTTVNRNYKDLDLFFQNKSGTVFEDGVRRGDIYKKVDIKAIDQSIKNILLTNWYEKPFQPFFGADLRRLLFELDTMVSEPDVRDLVTEAIEKWEPRVKVLGVDVYDPAEDEPVPKGVSNIFFYASARGEIKNHTLVIVVHGQIRNTGQEISTQVNMNRIR